MHPHSTSRPAFLAMLGVAAALGLSSCENPTDSPTTSTKTADSSGRVGVTVTVPRGNSQVIAQLAQAYRDQDRTRFENLLSSDAEAPYMFFGDAASWDKVEDDRIAGRMFDPEAVSPAEPPVPAELWITSIEVSFKQLSPWSERPDLYRSDVNPNGLDPARWRATEAEYRTLVFFDMQGDADYRIDGRQNFIVIEDLQGSLGTTSRFALYRWEDLGSGSSAKTPVTWSNVKQLFR